MQMKPLIIRFTENPEQEVALLSQEMRLSNLLAKVGSEGSIPSDVKGDLRTLLITIADMFNTSLPSLESDPEETLRVISRDMNLSRLLRERALFRMFRLATEKTGQVPMFMTMVNPDTGEAFARKEDFIGWFCREAKVSRSLVFGRLSTIAKAMDLGMKLEDVFDVVIAKPYATTKTLKLVATWKDGEMVSIESDTVRKLASRSSPEIRDNLLALAEKSDDGDLVARAKLHEDIKPLIVDLVNEVAAHDNVKDAMDYVTHDVLKRPEIRYRWDYESDTLKVEYVRKGIDPKGTEYIVEVTTIPFVPDVPELPAEVRADLIRRLPIINREILDI